MGLLDFLKRESIDGVEVRKDISYKELETLNSYLDKVGEDQVDVINSQIARVKAGLNGEEKVMYELKHLKCKAIIIHDLTLFDKNAQKSQMDFVILTPKCGFVIESKSLNGNININSDGEFKRQFINSQGKVYKSEGIYSPVRQNEIHIDVLKDLLIKNKFIKNYPIESIVVISNNKTIINKSYAPAKIKDLIVKVDQLDDKIMQYIDKYTLQMSDSGLIGIANFLIENDVPRIINYEESLKLKLIDDSIVEETKNAMEEGFIDDEALASKISDDSLINALKEYRISKAKELNYQPYFIFTNQQMEEIINKQPKSIAELTTISGFGEKKANLYGEDILKIINGPDYVLTTETNEDINVEENSELIQALKKYRLNKSREENIKPYYIFNDKQMYDLIKNKVSNKEEFINQHGFGEVKYSKYGEEILDILKTRLK